MKRSGILHPDIMHVLASTGHTDYILVTDSGFPVPPEPRRIDLALVQNVPTVMEVMNAIHGEFSIDRIVITEEMASFSPDFVRELKELLGSEVTVDVVTHVELKRLGHDAKATIRTGDTTLYANLLVVSG